MRRYVVLTPIERAMTGHVYAPGHDDQSEMGDQMRVTQCELQCDEPTHGLPNQDGRRGDPASHVIDEFLVAGYGGVGRD